MTRIPQGSLSQGFFGSELVECLEAGETLAELFRESSLGSLEPLVVRTPISGIRIAPANHYLAPFNTPSPEATGLQQFTLDAALSNLNGFDVCLIDCPPNLYACSWNALLAADFVVIPVPPEDFGTQGLRAVHQAIDHASHLNSKLRLLGHLVTRSDRRLVVHRAYEQQLRQVYGDTVLNTVIPEASAFKVSLACREPVTQYAPRSKAARLTSQLSCEILERIHRMNQRQHVA